MTKMTSQRFIVIALVVSVAFLSGCASFRKKFSRKPKNEEKEIEDVVFVPEEYPDNPYSLEERYAEQYLFWKSWQGELINYLNNEAGRKKQIDCADEALKSLGGMRMLLPAQKQVELDSSISELKGIRQELTEPRLLNMGLLRNRAQRIQNAVSRDFSTRKVKELLVQ